MSWCERPFFVGSAVRVTCFWSSALFLLKVLDAGKQNFTPPKNDKCPVGAQFYAQPTRVSIIPSLCFPTILRHGNLVSLQVATKCTTGQVYSCCSVSTCNALTNFSDVLRAPAGSPCQSKLVDLAHSVCLPNGGMYARPHFIGMAYLRSWCACMVCGQVHRR